MATIVEAIKVVLSDCPEGLTSIEIYNKIVENNLYTFNAISPQAIVNGTVRKHCYGLDFPSASLHKFFQIINNVRGRSRYALYDENQPNTDKSVLALSKERLPEEKLRDVYLEYIISLKTQLMNSILNSSPAFFEELVLELILKMGYGYDKHAGAVTRYSKDGGVDGIIEEDKLGLDKIYIQAKRYAIGNNVGDPALNQFLGTMVQHGVTKGVFITTSDFVSGMVEKYSKPIEGKMMRLINGDELMEYLIQYEIGVKNVMTYKTFALDENYFNS